MAHRPRGVVSRRAALAGVGTVALAACGSGGVSSLLGSQATSPSGRRMHLDITQTGSGGSPRLGPSAATTAGPRGTSVGVSDGLFTGYDSSGSFVAQIDTSTEDAYGMPIMKIVTANGTTATVTFPDLSTLTAGTPWAFTFQNESYNLLASAETAGNVQLLGPDGSVTSLSTNANGDRMLTDPKGNQFTMTGDEIDRIGALVYANASPSPAPSYTASPAPSMSAMAAVRNTSFSRAAMLRRPAQVAQTPSGSPSASPTPSGTSSPSGTPTATATPMTPSPSPSPSACPPEMKAKCERLRDAIFLLYYVAVAAIVAIGLLCVAGSFFAAAFCTIAVAAGLALATAQMLRSVRLFNFGYCAKTCHVYA